MDPATLIPTPDALQVPWGWFQFLLLLTFFFHLLFMNAALGCGLIIFLKQFFTPRESTPLSRDLAGKLTYAIAFTVNFGVAPLLFLQVLYGHFMYTSSILMGAYWLAIIGLLVVAYSLAYLYMFRFEALAAGRNRLLGTSLLLMLVVAFFFTNNMVLMLTPEAWPAYFSHPGGTFLNLSEPTVTSRYLHFIVAAVATGGLVLAILARFQKDIDEQERRVRTGSGMQWFTYATVVEIGIGIVFLFNLPPRVAKIFIGGGAFPTIVFLAAMTGTAFCLIYGFKKKVRRAAFAMAATIFLMVVVRDLARQAYLAPSFTPAQLPLAPQYSPMLVFFIVLALGAALVWYMLRLAGTNGRERRP